MQAACVGLALLTARRGARLCNLIVLGCAGHLGDIVGLALARFGGDCHNSGNLGEWRAPAKRGECARARPTCSGHCSESQFPHL